MRTAAHVAAIAIALLPATAAALPAVLVGAAPARLRNHRSHLVLAQDGPRTVLGLQIDVLAIPMDLAIVLPIHGDVDPDSLQTIDRRLFERLDQLAAPRLEHVWEQDPCAPSPAPPTSIPATPRPYTFVTGEYDFAVLGRIGAGELDTWLRERGFPLDAGHAAALAEHFTAGATFVVARVDRRQVHFDARGRATLSPLRVAFTPAPGWRIPLRTGTGHAIGPQDVVIDAILPGQQLTTDQPAAAIPSLALTPAAADRFPAVHAAIAAAVRRTSGGLALLEHTAPLPPAGLAPAELAALGVAEGGPPPVLSRLHLRYAPGDLLADPEPRAAAFAGPDIRARHLVRHPWTGPVNCDAPVRGVWGPPIDGVGADAPRWVHAMSPAAPVADLAPYIAEDVPQLGLTAAPAGCTCTAAPASSLGLAGLLALARRRRRSARV